MFRGRSLAIVLAGVAYLTPGEAMATHNEGLDFEPFDAISDGGIQQAGADCPNAL